MKSITFKTAIKKLGYVVYGHEKYDYDDDTLQIYGDKN